MATSNLSNLSSGGRVRRRWRVVPDAWMYPESLDRCALIALLVLLAFLPLFGFRAHQFKEALDDAGYPAVGNGYMTGLATVRLDDESLVYVVLDDGQLMVVPAEGGRRPLEAVAAEHVAGT